MRANASGPYELPAAPRQMGPSTRNTRLVFHSVSKMDANSSQGQRRGVEIAADPPANQLRSSNAAAQHPECKKLRHGLRPGGKRPLNRLWRGRH